MSFLSMLTMYSEHDKPVCKAFDCAAGHEGKIQQPSQYSGYIVKGLVIVSIAI